MRERGLSQVKKRESRERGEERMRFIHEHCSMPLIYLCLSLFLFLSLPSSSLHQNTVALVGCVGERMQQCK
jgi:hypothetical protein